MTKKEMKKLIKDKISIMVEGKVTSKELGSINMKHINKWLNEEELEVVLYCLEMVSNDYYSWEVPSTQVSPSDNSGRLIHLVNKNLDMAKFLYNKPSKYIMEEENDYEIKTKNTKDIKSYKELAESVGL